MGSNAKVDCLDWINLVSFTTKSCLIKTSYHQELFKNLCYFKKLIVILCMLSKETFLLLDVVFAGLTKVVNYQFLTWEQCLTLAVTNFHNYAKGNCVSLKSFLFHQPHRRMDGLPPTHKGWAWKCRWGRKHYLDKNQIVPGNILPKRFYLSFLFKLCTSIYVVD